MNSEGIIINSSEESTIGSDKSSDDYFVNARNGPYVKPAYYSETVKRLLIVISGPYDGGVIAAKIELEAFNEIFLTYIGLDETGEGLLAYRNEEGDAEFFTERRFETEGEARDIIPKEEVNIPITQALLGNEEAFLDYVDYRDVPVFAVTKYIGEIDVGLVVKMDKEEALEGVFRNTAQIWYSTSGIIIAIIIIGIIFNFLLTSSLRREVASKTEVLMKKTDQLERFAKLAVGREKKMIELKGRIKKYEGRK